MKSNRLFLIFVIFVSFGFANTLLGQTTAYKGKIKELNFYYPSNWSMVEYENSKYNKQVVLTAPNTKGWLTITVDTTSKSLDTLYKEKVLTQYRYKPELKEGKATINGNAAKWAGTFIKTDWYNYKFTYLVIKNDKAYFFDGQGATNKIYEVCEEEQTIKELLLALQIVQ